MACEKHPGHLQLFVGDNQGSSNVLTVASKKLPAQITEEKILEKFERTKKYPECPESIPAFKPKS